MEKKNVYLTKKEGRWYAMFIRDDLRKWKSMGTDDYDVAKAKVMELELAYYKGTYDPWAVERPEPVETGTNAVSYRRLVSEFLAAMEKKGLADSTLSVYKSHLNGMLKVDRVRLASKITHYCIDTGVNSTLSASTLRSRARTMSAFSAWVKESGEWGTFEALIPVTRRRTSGRRAVTEDEVRRILDADTTPPWLKYYVEFAFYSGLRMNEMVSMQWKHVAVSYIDLPFTKAGVPQRIPITSVLRKVFDKIAFRRPHNTHSNELVFKGYAGRPLTARYLQREFRRSCEAIGIMDATIHGLRHGFCTMLAQNGASSATIKALARHADIRTSEGYIHLSNEDLNKQAEMLVRKGYA